MLAPPRRSQNDNGSAVCSILAGMRKTGIRKKKDPEEEARRLADLLDLLVRVSNRSHRSLEEQLGLGSAGLSKILRGTVRLQASHITRICEAVGVAPGHFFQLAYPDLGPPGKLIEDTRAVLKLPPVKAERLDEEDEDDEKLPKDFERKLRRLLREIEREKQEKR